jgi:hypothetical protein
VNDEFEDGQSYYRNIIPETKEIPWKSESWYSVSTPPVSTVTRAGQLGFLIPEVRRDYWPHHRIQNDHGSHSAFYATVTGDSNWVKRTGSKDEHSLPNTKLRRLRTHRNIPPFHHRSSRRSAYLYRGTTFTFRIKNSARQSGC